MFELFAEYHVSTKILTFLVQQQKSSLTRYSSQWGAQHIDHNLFRNGQLHLQHVSKHFEIDSSLFWGKIPCSMCQDEAIINLKQGRDELTKTFIESCKKEQFRDRKFNENVYEFEI